MDRRLINLSFSLFLWYSIVRSAFSDNPCPFEAMCECSDPVNPERTTFEWAKCEFDKKSPVNLDLDNQHGQYAINGELLIAGDFEKGFSLGQPLADVFTHIEQLSLVNLNRKASLVRKVPVDLVKHAPVKTLLLQGFRQFLEALTRYQDDCWQDVENLIILKSQIHDYSKEGVQFVNGFPKLNSLTIEESDVQALLPTGFDPLKEKLTELTLKSCQWKEYPTLEGLTMLKKLVLESSAVASTATKTSCTFCSLDGLEELHLYGKDLHIAIDAKAFNRLPKNLVSIYLNRGQLSQVPISVTAKNVLRLSVADNNIDSIITKNFHLHNHLQFLSLDNNPVKTIVPGAFKSLSALETLEMRNTKMRSFDLSALTGAMGSLKSLALDGNKLMETVSVSAIDQVPANLETISLTQTQLDKVDPSLEELLKRGEFQTLDISDTVIVHCDDVKWLVKYAMCEDNVKVQTSNTVCGNAKGKPFSDYMRVPAMRECKPAAAPAEEDAAAVREPEAPPAEPEPEPEPEPAPEPEPEPEPAPEPEPVAAAQEQLTAADRVQVETLIKTVTDEESKKQLEEIKVCVTVKQRALRGRGRKNRKCPTAANLRQTINAIAAKASKNGKKSQKGKKRS